jgi:hypothetical protein
MTTPTATTAETIVHFTRHLAEPGCCGPAPPDPRAARRSPAARSPRVPAKKQVNQLITADEPCANTPSHT